MQSTLRPSFAAATLLACAAALLGQPALARDAHPVLQPVVFVDPARSAENMRGHGGDDHGWRHGWRRDESAPTILDLTPLPGERVGERHRTTVSARFADHASGVDPASVRLRLDGRDVTGGARVDDAEVHFRDDLSPGRHVAEVIVRDRAGNTARRSWQFDVVDRERHAYPDEGSRRGARGWQR